jgi:hypothetical protein
MTTFFIFISLPWAFLNLLPHGRQGLTTTAAYPTQRPNQTFRRKLARLVPTTSLFTKREQNVLACVVRGVVGVILDRLELSSSTRGLAVFGKGGWDEKAVFLRAVCSRSVVCVTGRSGGNDHVVAGEFGRRWYVHGDVRGEWEHGWQFVL